MISSFYSRFLTKINRKNILMNCSTKLLICNKNLPSIISNNRALCSIEQADSDTAPTIKDNRVSFFKLNKILKNRTDLKEFTKEQITLFMQCCGKISVYETPNSRIAALNNVWNQLEQNKYEFDVENYNVYVEIYTENKIHMDCESFLAKMQCKPNYNTYKLLLRNVCEKGDLEQIFYLLNLIKENGFIVDEEIFNYLVLGHTVHNGLEAAKTIFNMMKVANKPIAEQTNFALTRGLILNGNFEEFKTVLQHYSFTINEQRFLTLIEDLALTDRYLWLPEILIKTSIDSVSKHSVQLLCVQLVTQKKFDAALYFYKNLIKPTSSEYGYGKEIIRQMVKTKAPIAKIVDVVMDFKNSNLNPLALENATEIALFTEYLELAWCLFEKFTCLRPHFFWPILLSTGRSDGESGILNTLESMYKLGVKADTETLEKYSLVFCNLTEQTLLIKKLQNIGYTVKEILTPLCVVLLTQHELEKTQRLCASYNVQIFAEHLITPLIANWKNSKNPQPIVQILQKVCETNSANLEYLESFLIKIFLVAKKVVDVKKLVATLKELKQKKIYINPIVSDNLLKITNKKFVEMDDFAELRDLIDSLQDVSITEEPKILPHPRDMTLEQLECHLLELESKNMETRGVLRKLIQLHSNIGNNKRVMELRNKFIANGYNETPGLKSAMMHNQILLKNLTTSLDLYQEIKMLHSSFRMDSYKIIDLATLLVENGKIEDALDILNEEAKNSYISGGRGIQKNCLNLLKAAKNPIELDTIFQTLINCGYCKATNIILGPLVYIHIKNNDLENAVKMYENCSKKYKATPQQLELLRTTLKQRQAELFHRVVNATEEVHGKSGAYLAVIAALAEEGMRESLKQFLVKSPFIIKKETIHKRYDRWVEEKKLLPLKTMASILEKLSLEHLDLPYIQLSIMRLYSLNNDCESALTFWDELVSDGFSSKEISAVLLSLLIKNKYNVPKSLQVQAQ